MKLQNFTVIFVIILIPIILLMSMYITNGIKTIKYQSLYDAGLLNATHDAIYAFEQNTSNDEFSGNPEIKRDILKSSVKMFEKSLSNACNVSSYSTDEIEEYIPAIVFGMYDGFYMYAPSYNSITGKYEHSLKNYVYYSETLQNAYGDVVITYSLDNYITVSGKFNDDDGYEIKKGYLMQINPYNTNQGTGNEYAGIDIGSETIDGEVNTDGKKYHTMAFQFTYWFLYDSGLIDIEIDGVQPFKISSTNDPEDENSIFVKHKRKIIKNKIEGVLNSTITAYSERTWGQIYKMPKLLEEDLEKIYSNISMLTFFQGKSIGLTKYNGYCVANSTNSKEYVNPNLMYFTDGIEYHDIRCDKCESVSNLNGYRIGAFEKKKVEELDASGNIVYEDGRVKYKYIYDHNELACYNCINGTRDKTITVYDYVKPNSTASDETIKTAYWTSLGRERYDPNKITPIDLEIDVRFDSNEGNEDFSGYDRTYEYNQNIIFPTVTPTKTGYKFYGWSEVKDVRDNITSAQALVDITYYASWIGNQYTIEYYGIDCTGSTAPSTHIYGEYQNLTPNGFAKTGHTFAGWRENATGREFDDKERVINLAEDDGATVKLNAKWRVNTYTIEYKANGGTGIMSNSTHTYGVAKELNENAFTRTGYLFKGWSKDPYGSVEYDDKATVTSLTEIDGATITLYAVWEGIEYTIKYDGNGATEGSTAVSTHIYNEEKELTPNGFKKTGYVFDGWETKQVEVNDGDKVYGDKEKVINLASTNGVEVIMTVKWRPITYTVVYNANGGTGTMDNTTHTYGEYSTLRKNTFTKEGYKFVGWADNTDGIKDYDDEHELTYYATEEDGVTVTLYAIWEGIEYTVEYDGNGATGGSTAISTHRYGEAQNLTTNGYTKTGYTFIGWATSASGSVEYSNGQSVSNLTTTKGGRVMLYAVWQVNTYTVAYNANGGTGTMDNTTHTYGVASNLRANAFTRSGYTFEGWSESESGSVKYSNGQSVTDLTTTNGGIVNLYAKWKKNSEPPVFVNGSDNVTVSVSHNGTEKNGIGKPRTIYVDLSITLGNIANAEYYEIEIWGNYEKNTSMRLLASGRYNSGFTASLTPLCYNGTYYSDYDIKIKAYNSQGEYEEKTRTVWISTTLVDAGVESYDPKGCKTGNAEWRTCQLSF